MSVRAFSGSLAGRIVLLLAGAVIAANLIALGALSLQRGTSDLQARDEREVERIAALVPAMQAVDAAARHQIARDASTRFARVRISGTPLVRETHPDARSQRIALQLAETLQRDDIAVALTDAPTGRTREHGESRFFRPQTLIVSVPLSARGGEDAWMNVATVTAPPRDRPGDERVPLIILGASLLAVLIVAALLARLLTKPLGRMAQAARAAGRGDRSARVPETGPLEVRDAAVAFNKMQSQIARFDAERMRLLASVGHDLRTPITSLRIRAEMIDDPQERAATIRTLDEMTVMAESLVSYGREGQEREVKVPINLREFLGQLCEDLGADCDPMPDLAIRARPVGLRRAIGNLIENAQRYGGGARLSLSRSGERAVIHIDDSGPGIAPQRIEEMFAPFTRGEASRNSETGGSGLGLSIARSILNAHGGELTLENRAQGGLRATVTLPIEISDQHSVG